MQNINAYFYFRFGKHPINSICKKKDLDASPANFVTVLHRSKAEML